VADEERPELAKEAVKLADGRRLIYYWFANPAPRPRPAGEPQDELARRDIVARAPRPRGG
jgi:hypothetical protein